MMNLLGAFKKEPAPTQNTPSQTHPAGQAIIGTAVQSLKLNRFESTNFCLSLLTMGTNVALRTTAEVKFVIDKHRHNKYEVEKS